MLHSPPSWGDQTGAYLCCWCVFINYRDGRAMWVKQVSGAPPNSAANPLPTPVLGIKFPLPAELLNWYSRH